MNNRKKEKNSMPYYNNKHVYPLSVYRNFQRYKKTK